jgi:hypothetical protein
VWQVLFDLKSQLTDVQNKQEQMDVNLKQLMSSFSLPTEHHDTKGRDRKRLKERLKKASLKATKQKLLRGASWLELIFGITRGDRRVGKGGSRSLLCVKCM